MRGVTELVVRLDGKPSWQVSMKAVEVTGGDLEEVAGQRYKHRKNVQAYWIEYTATIYKNLTPETAGTGAHW